ncbi:hypothetical protein AALP_AA6G227400 [Arabis alpina]|uniref:Exocyst subunit Exo70 family protein n=1 Tax=Arabis alpina TaxID=50452 RepID=A0A087GR24_ARAAL|nr:hypothetical protein AALP_AA6G227400 [Arabis alpina]
MFIEMGSSDLVTWQLFGGVIYSILSLILQCLTVQSSRSGPVESMNISRTSIKDRFKTFNSQFEELHQRQFKTFNSQFEELHQRQCQWTVPDNELRESLRLTVAEFVGPMIESGKNPQKYIRFTPEDLE